MPDPATYEVLFVDQNENSLPTPDDISNCKDATLGPSRCRLICMHERFMIKFGVYVKPIEGYNMLHVAKSTSIPVPKVYAIYQQHQQQGISITYIVMQYIPGSTLQASWDSLDDTRKIALAGTLRSYFDQLRQLPHPGYFGNITGGLPLDDIFSATKAAEDEKTQLTTEDELIAYIIRIYSVETGQRTSHRARYYQHVLPTTLRGNGSPVFTHNDLQRKNIMLQPDGVPVIIDWEFASWYPTYWEYATAIYANGDWNDDWHDYVRLILDEYPNQCLWLSTMKREMWS